jgi:hypothetical protein
MWIQMAQLFIRKELKTTHPQYRGYVPLEMQELLR